MRRPWLLGGALAGLAGLVVMAAAPNLALLLVGWSLAAMAYNGLLAALLAVLPDQVPPQQRGSVSGVIGVSQALAAVLGTGLAGSLSGQRLLMFTVPGLVTLLLTGFLFLRLRDRTLNPADRHPFSAGELARSLWVDPRRSPDFGWAWLSRFMVFMAIASVLNYQLFFVTDRLDRTGDDAQHLVLSGVVVQTVVVVLTSNLVGWLSDRLGHRRVFVCLSAGLAAAGLLVLATAATVPQYLLALAVIGLGQGTYFAVDLALVTDVLPNRTRDAAKDLGVMNIANTLPQSLAPAVAPLFLALGAGHNYTALFVGGACYALVSGLSILAVRGAR